MHIGIDARFYGPTAKGLGRYVQKLLEHLALLDHDHTISVFLRKENWDRYQAPDARFTKVLADIPWYSMQEQLKLAPLLRSVKPDLMHFPHYNVPVLYRQPFVVTVHDLIVSRFPTRRASTLGPILYTLKNAAYHQVIRSAILRARSILTVSEFSKQEILDVYHADPNKITVTYEAADLFPQTTVDHATEAKIQSYGSYLLYVGNAYPHKNLEGLVAAFQALQKEYTQPLKLVLVGKMEYFYSRLRTTVQEQGIQNVIFAGGVSDAELGALYRHATLYVFPSFMEGFGLPPLEAMQAGVPVVSSNLSCLPEVLGNAADYFDPHDISAMTKVMRLVLENPQRQNELRALGKLQAQRFHWDDLARTTLDVYTKAVR